MPPGNHHWKLLEKKFQKREKQAIEQRQQVNRRAKLMKVRTMKVPVTVLLRTVFFGPTMNTSMVETMSVATFVSFHGDECHDTPPKSMEATVTGSCGKAEKKDLISAVTQKSKSDTLDFERLSVGSNFSNSSQSRQQSSSNRLKQEQLNLKLESKRIKLQVEQYQKQKEDEFQQLPKKMQFLEL